MTIFQAHEPSHGSDLSTWKWKWFSALFYSAPSYHLSSYLCQVQWVGPNTYYSCPSGYSSSYIGVCYFLRKLWPLPWGVTLLQSVNTINKRKSIYHSLPQRYDSILNITIYRTPKTGMVPLFFFNNFSSHSKIKF